MLYVSPSLCKLTHTHALAKSAHAHTHACTQWLGPAGKSKQSSTIPQVLSRASPPPQHTHTSPAAPHSKVPFMCYTEGPTVRALHLAKCCSRFSSLSCLATYLSLHLPQCMPICLSGCTQGKSRGVTSEFVFTFCFDRQVRAISASNHKDDPFVFPSFQVVPKGLLGAETGTSHGFVSIL